MNKTGVLWAVFVAATSLCAMEEWQLTVRTSDSREMSILASDLERIRPFRMQYKAIKREVRDSYGELIFTIPFKKVSFELFLTLLREAAKFYPGQALSSTHITRDIYLYRSLREAPLTALLDVMVIANWSGHADSLSAIGYSLLADKIARLSPDAVYWNLLKNNIDFFLKRHIPELELERNLLRNDLSLLYKKSYTAWMQRFNVWEEVMPKGLLFSATQSLLYISCFNQTPFVCNVQASGNGAIQQTRAEAVHQYAALQVAHSPSGRYIIWQTESSKEGFFQYVVYDTVRGGVIRKLRKAKREGTPVDPYIILDNEARLFFFVDNKLSLADKNDLKKISFDLSSLLDIQALHTGMLVFGHNDLESQRGKILCFDLQPEKIVYDITLEDLMKFFYVTPDGEVLASVENDNFVKIWDMRKKEAIRMKKYASPHNIVIDSKKRLMAISDGPKVSLVDGYTGKIIKRFNVYDQVKELAFDEEMHKLAIAASSVRVVDLKTDLYTMSSQDEHWNLCSLYGLDEYAVVKNGYHQQAYQDCPTHLKDAYHEVTKRFVGYVPVKKFDTEESQNYSI